MAKDQWKEEQKPILDRFKKIIEVSDEKVELSTTLHSSVGQLTTETLCYQPTDG